MKYTYILFLCIFSIMNIIPVKQLNAENNQLTEKLKIEYLIKSVENLDGAKFYRNGIWYDPGEAAAHLRLKLKNAGSRIKTARQFIDKIATHSSMSGLTYKIKFKDGMVIEAKVFFYQQLSKYSSD